MSKFELVGSGMVAQPLTVYEIVEQSTPQTTITDVLLGAVWVVAGLAAIAVTLGVVCAGILIGVRRIRETNRASDASDMTRLGLNSPH